MNEADFALDLGIRFIASYETVLARCELQLARAGYNPESSWRAVRDIEGGGTEYRLRVRQPNVAELRLTEVLTPSLLRSHPLFAGLRAISGRLYASDPRTLEQDGDLRDVIGYWRVFAPEELDRIR